MRFKQVILKAALSLIMSAMSSTVAHAQLKYHVIPIAPGYGAGINDKGDVVGTLSDNHHAFLYKKGKIRDLGVFYDPANLPNYTDGNAVNDSDVVVGDITDNGRSGTSEGRLDAFLWHKSHLIDIAQGTVDGGAPATAMAINNSGDVGGTYDAGPFLHFALTGAFVYSGGRMVNLNFLVDGGWNIVSVGHINDSGQIAATGTRPGSTVTYALLLTPDWDLLQ